MSLLDKRIYLLKKQFRKEYAQGNKKYDEVLIFEKKIELLIKCWNHSEKNHFNKHEKKIKNKIEKKMNKKLKKQAIPYHPYIYHDKFFGDYLNSKSLNYIPNKKYY